MPRKTKKPPPYSQPKSRARKKPIDDYVTLNHPGTEITDEEWAFIQAIQRYQTQYRVRYPTWREVLYVLTQLGYAKQ